MPFKRKRDHSDHLSNNCSSSMASSSNGSATAAMIPIGEVDVQTVRTDLNALIRVKHRLTMIDTTEKLSSVLEKLLPRLFLKMNDNYQQLQSLPPTSVPSTQASVRDLRQKMHDQFIELLSETMMRVRDETACRVPCREILQVFMSLPTQEKTADGADASSSPPPIDQSSNLKSFNIYTINLALALVQVGIGRCAVPDYWMLLPMLFYLLEDSSVVFGISSSSHERITHLLITTLLGIVHAAPDATNDDFLVMARAICLRHAPLAVMLYDLFLDILFYQPTEGTIPPAGLSIAGWNRLRGDLTDRGRLRSLKVAILDFVAPTKRFRLFLDPNPVDHMSPSMNLERTLVLLIVASSDPVLREVSEYASAQLKQHLDNVRTVKHSKDVVGVPHSVLGDPMVVAIELISLALGQVYAESVLKSSSLERRLGVTTPSSVTTPQRLDKRRPLDEMTQSPALMNFVSNNILTEYPGLFQDHSLDTVLSFSGVVIQLVHRILSTFTGGLSTLRAKPYLAAANVLNALTIRLVALYDRLVGMDDALTQILCRTLSITCDVFVPVATSAVVAQRSRAAMAGYNDGSIAVRDVCYGIITTLSRSHFAIHPRGYLFCLGKASTSSDDDSSIGAFIFSIDTAVTLFGCVSNEEDRLRPRAVAALDALLAAYCRACIHDPAKSTIQNGNRIASTSGGQVPESTGSTAPFESSNPWLTAPSNENSKATSTSIAVPSTISGSHATLAKSLLPLLWTAAQSRQSKASRVAASRWASALLKDIDLLNACHIMCFLSGDSDTVVSSIAREGLNMPETKDDEYLSTMSASDIASSNFPDFNDFAAKLFSESQTSRQHFWDFSHHGKIATLRCGLLCLLSDLYGGSDVSVGIYISTVMKTFQEVVGVPIDESSSQGKALIDLLDECSACLLATVSASQYARLQITGNGTIKLPICIIDIQDLSVSTNSSRSRRYFAAVCGEVFEDFSIWSTNPVESYDDWLLETRLATTLVTCSNHLLDIDKKNSTIGRLHGSAFLGAHCVRAVRLLTLHVSAGKSSHESYAHLNNILHCLGKGLLHEDDMIANACSDCLAIALSYDTIDAPLLDFRFCESSTSILSNLTKALNKFAHCDALNSARALKTTKSSGICLAATTAIIDLDFDDSDKEKIISLQRARLDCEKALFEVLGSMACRKEEEISIVVGESLALFADAGSSEDIVWSRSGSDVWPRDFDEDFADRLPPHEQVIFILLRKIFAANSPHKRTSCASALLAIVSRGAYLVHTSTKECTRPLVRCLLDHLKEIQQVFLALLSDPKGRQFSRESSCLGLIACRGLVVTMDSLGTSPNQMIVNDLNQRLLRAFGQTTNYGGSAMMETVEQAAARRRADGLEGEAETLVDSGQSEVGGASGIGEAALGAYREMASASVALGREDFMYSLLFLSLSHPYWQSEEGKHRYSAASLLGESFSLGTKATSVEFRDALRPHLAKLIPRILRGCYDPNKQTKDQMTSLWRGLTGGGAEGRLAVSQHLLTTIDTLINDCSSKLWRARVGACGALSEIIVGREWDELGGGGPILNDDDFYDGTVAGVRLIRIWTVASRALDDVQGSVRDCGETLARAAKALTIRLCSSLNDPQIDKQKDIISAERDAASAAGTSLWWLMRKGLNQTCPEVIGVCLSTLVEVVGVVRPAILEPSLSTLLSSLLLAVSALEPAALNYMQLRTSDHDGLERTRLQLAQSGPLASALTKCLELVPFTKLETKQSIAPALDTVLRQSAGFATRAAVADAVSTLCNSSPEVFQFVGANTTNPSVRLLRAFYYASERERGPAAKDKMIHALGNLASLCPASSVRCLAVRACERYRFCTGNNFDPPSRRAAAGTLRTIAVRASNVFGDGGRSDVWCSLVLPVAYLGRKDSDSQVASMWQEVWDEGGSVVGASGSLSSSISFGTRLEETLLPSLVNEAILALQDVSWERRGAGASALQDLCQIGVLAPISRSVQEPTKYDTAILLRAQIRAKASCRALQQCLTLATKPRLWNGKSELLKAITSITSKWSCALASCDQTIYDISVLGWDSPEEPCPWLPLTISPGKFKCDLCVNDGWFNKLKNDQPEVQPEVLLRDDNDVSNSDDRATIDFQQCDDFLKEEGERVAPFPVEKFDTYGTATFTGLCRFLLEQALPSYRNLDISTVSDESLVYRTTAFRCFRDFLNTIMPSFSELRIELYNMSSPLLLEMIGSCLAAKEMEKKYPPVLISGAINCIETLLWDGVGLLEGRTQAISVNSSPRNCLALLKEVGGVKQPAWTVREAVALCIAQFVRLCDKPSLQDHTVVSQMVDAARIALNDRKFWKVRIAGLKILSNLVERGGGGKIERQQLILESLLPHKENIVSLVRTGLNDNEANVTALSTSIVKQMSWWP